MTAVVIHSIIARTLRRVVVSDVLTLDQVALTCAPGEAAMEVPFDSYSRENDAEVRAYVAAQIGEPLQSCRCVEVDRNGKCVAVSEADPAIDKPMFDVGNTLELHPTAVVGDVKVTGEFPPPPKKPDPIPPLPPSEDP